MTSARFSVALRATCLSFAALFFAGCHNNRKPAPTTDIAAAPVVTVTRTTLANQLTVAGEFLPFEEVELHAKVAGYVRKMNVDIGDRVHAGEVLATLDVPELNAQVVGATAGVAQSQEQIARSRSEVSRAQADYIAIHASSQRLEQASKAQPGLIAQQELDNAKAKDAASAAAVDAAKSALAATEQALGISRAQQTQVISMADYSRIIAPFDGIVTWRYADPGALIQAGTSNAASAPVVKVAQVSTLRLRLPVPEALASFVRLGDAATLRVSALDRTLQGTVTRTTGALDPSTRTMQVEVDVPNQDNSLTPGMYAQVTLNVQRAGDVLALPQQAIDSSNPAQPFVMVVDASHHVQRRNVTTGIATANRVEILTGLRAGEQVISTNLGAYNPGELVMPHAEAVTFNEGAN